MARDRGGELLDQPAELADLVATAWMRSEPAGIGRVHAALAGGRAVARIGD